MRNPKPFYLVLTVRFLAIFFCGISLEAQVLTLESVSTGGVAANGQGAAYGWISGDGRFISFRSNATNLSSQATNGSQQAYLRDRQLNTTELVSMSTAGLISNGVGDVTSVNDTGVLVGFTSEGSVFDATTPTSTTSFFLRNRNEQTTTRALKTIGQQAVPIAGGFLTGGGNPNRIVLTSNSLNSNDPAVLSDVGQPLSGTPAVLFVSFQIETRRVNMSSNADPNLQQDTGDISNGVGTDIAPSSSTSGRYICFQSASGNLVTPPVQQNTNIYVRDQDTKQILLVSTYEDGSRFSASTTDCAMSGDGEYVMFSGPGDLLPGGTSATIKQFYRKAWRSATPALVRVSDTDDEQPFNALNFGGTLSGDGRYAAFTSFATNAPGATSGSVGVYVRDIEGGTTRRVDVDSTGTPPSFSNPINARISSNGNFVVFTATFGATNQIYLSEINATVGQPTPVPAVNTITLKKATVFVSGRKKLELGGTVKNVATGKAVVGARVTVNCRRTTNQAVTLNKTVTTKKKGVYSVVIGIPAPSKKSQCTATSDSDTSKSIKIP